MWSFGLITVFIGYAFIYYGVMNIRTGGTGPKMADVFGFPRTTLVSGTGRTAKK